MNLNPRTALICFALPLVTPASAQDTTTANQMLPGCKGLLDNRMTSGVSVYQQGRCGGYVASLVYGIGGQEFCSPKEVSIGQAVTVVIKYIEARPERMHEAFDKLALEALRQRRGLASANPLTTETVKDRETHLALRDKPTVMLYHAILADAPSRNW